MCGRGGKGDLSLKIVIGKTKSDIIGAEEFKPALWLYVNNHTSIFSPEMLNIEGLMNPS